MGQGPTSAKARLHFVRLQLSDFNLNPRPPFIAKQKQMLIRIGYDIALRIPAPTAVVCVLRVHPSREGDLVGPEEFRLEPDLPVEEYMDGFDNHCGRVNVPGGVIRFLNDAVIRDPGELDAYAPDAPQHDVRDIPVETLRLLLPSR